MGSGVCVEADRPTGAALLGERALALGMLRGQSLVATDIVGLAVREPRRPLVGRLLIGERDRVTRGRSV